MDKLIQTKFGKVKKHLKDHQIKSKRKSHGIRKPIWMLGAAVLLMALLTSGCRDTKSTATESADSPTEIFLATMHDSTGPSAHANATSGMLIASSTDGVNFHNISDSIDSLYSPINGVRDPSVLYWQGQWYMVYSYGPSIEPLVFLIKSSDLLNWEPVGSLRLAPNMATNNYIDIPQWIVDPDGNVHIIACVDDTHQWVEIHALNADPATWGDQNNWSAVATMIDHNGDPFVQGNSFVALRDGTYYMAFNGMTVTGTSYYMRTSTDLVSWSAPRLLDFDSSVTGETGESENIIFLSDGTLRYYISASNAETNEIWYVDSADLGVTWDSLKLVNFSGFDPKKINWAQFVRIINPPVLK